MCVIVYICVVLSFLLKPSLGMIVSHVGDLGFIIYRLGIVLNIVKLEEIANWARLDGITPVIDRGIHPLSMIMTVTMVWSRENP